MQPRSWLIAAYRLATRILTPLAGVFLRARMRRGKEDAERLDERLGATRTPRPAGALVWLHGASVGEALALLPLIDHLRSRGLQILITTGTVTSASVMRQRLPAGVIHQYAPLDAPRFLRRFLTHWRPSMLLIAESELWPNMLIETADAGAPIALVNARMSDRSLRRWLRAPGAAAAMLGRVTICLTQTEEDAQRFFRLGAPKVHVTGNLKFDSLAPPVDNAEYARLSAALGARPAWLAASTHAGEEEIAIGVHLRLRERWPDLVTMILPRHPERGPEIAALAQVNGLAPALRSRADPLPGPDGLYIADTIGETGLFYRLAGVAFIGRSLTGSGGQNPIEPAKIGAAIVHGPNVGNFLQVYRELHAGQGALEVADADDLAAALAQLLDDSARTRALARAAYRTVERIGGATGRIVLALEPYLLRIRLEEQ